MKKKYLLSSFIVLASLALIGASCTKQQLIPNSPSKQTTDNKNQQEVKIFNVTGQNFSFSIKEVTVQKGDRVKIVFASNEGFHDWVVDEFDAATSRVSVGQSTSIEFIADQVGTFEYYCSVGNHRQLGMVGKLIVEDDDALIKNNSTMEVSYKYSGDLTDVTNGKTTGGVNTQGKASGIVKANFEDGTYSLMATFVSLPDPQGTDFYEGWVVKKNPLSVVSTGKVEKVNGSYTNTYSSGKDLTDHDFYVLTIEPDDKNPEPADHILEGVMLKNN